MATEEPSRFERTGGATRLKGLLFEYLSLAASVVGILALALLLVYVTVDAFALSQASDGWVLSYLLTVGVPTVAFLLYAAGSRRVTQLAVLALGGGLVGSVALFRLVAALGGSIPRLSWPLVYLFAVWIPVGGYVAYAAAERPVGRAGVGLLGRLVGGAGVAAAIAALFVIVDVYLWFLAFTLALAPAAVTWVLARARGHPFLPFLAVPVAVVGLVVAVLLREFMVVFPATWVIYVVTLGVPVGLGAAALLGRGRSDRAALAGGAAVVVAAWAVGAAATLAGLPRNALVLATIAVVVPAALYVERVLRRRRGRVGLLLPVVLIVGALAGGVVVDLLGATGPDPWLDWAYLTSSPSRRAAEAGLYPAIVGSIFVIALVAVLSFALGVGTAVFLEDYTPDQGPAASVTRFVQVNISNLAGVPSVVYGLLGLGLFVNLVGLGFGTVIVAAVTLSLLILPIVTISAQEAIRSVPDDMRQASYGLGATRWQTTKNVVLPEAMPGILTGTILSLGRAIGETAPLIMIGAPTTVYSPPGGLFSRTSAMPMQIYAWADFPQEEFRYGVVAAGVVTLLVVLVGMNATAILLRNRYERSEG